MSLINVGLIKHPINWLTIMLMLLIAAMAGHYTLTFFGVEPATKEN